MAAIALQSDQIGLCVRNISKIVKPLNHLNKFIKLKTLWRLRNIITIKALFRHLFVCYDYWVYLRLRCYEKKVWTAMVNNSTYINKTNTVSLFNHKLNHDTWSWQSTSWNGVGTEFGGVQLVNGILKPLPLLIEDNKNNTKSDNVDTTVNLFLS